MQRGVLRNITVLLRQKQMALWSLHRRYRAPKAQHVGDDIPVGYTEQWGWNVTRKL